MIYCYCTFCEIHYPKQYLPKQDWIKWKKLSDTNKIQFDLNREIEDRRIQQRINLKK